MVDKDGVMETPAVEQSLATSRPPRMDTNLCIWFQLVAIKMVVILS